MNTLASILVSSMVHATGFALLGTLVYLAWRRFGPAAGALAACSSLVMMALVSLIVLGPWPEWWSFAPDESGGPAAQSDRGGRVVSGAPQLARGHESKSSAEEAAPTSARPHIPGSDPSVTPNWLSVFVRELSRELSRPAPDAAPTHWSWRDWLAIGFLAALGLGTLRLALGIWAIRQLRAGSVPIDDRALNEAMDILRAQTSCSKKVGVRETAELASAATIGWRKPLLLLPADWRDWNQAERLAVLAHEVAHVRRGDFLAGMAAQFCLALQFYHPLAHWLAARLRLEQELAADAWAAQLTGGKQAYLVTLAQIALRRDSRRLTWPARAFLPSRGTFVRRIEMLRNTNRIRPASLSRVAHGLTLATLAALGLLVASLRWPAAGEAARADQAAPAAGLAQNAGNESFNLSFLPAEAKMILAIRPKALLERPQVRALFDQMKQTLSLETVEPLKVEDIDQLLVFWEANFPLKGEPVSAFLVPLPSGCVVHAAKPLDWKPLLDPLLTPRREAVRHAGQTYFAGTGPRLGWSAFVADDQTLVFARDDLLRELIEDRGAPAARHPWDEAWQKAVKGQMMLALDMRWVRRGLGQDLRPGPNASDFMVDTVAPLLEKTQSYVLSIDTAEGVVVDLVTAAISDNDAKPVADTISALLTFARNATQRARQDLGAQRVAAGEHLDWGFRAVDTLLEKARIDTSARYVHVQSKTSLDIGEATKILAPALSAAQAASRRTQSMNNLKQIALAIHNYVGVNKGHLPTPVLYARGPNKSVPYSWRVAILPYLDQNELYKQYDFGEPWDGPNNRKLIDKMPVIYSYPKPGGGASSQANASYFVLTGEATAFGSTVRGKEGANTFMDMTDGLSNTIMVVEAKREIPWTKPEDIPFDANGPLPELGGFARDVFNVAFADGSVRAISYKIDPGVLKALITRAGGEVINLDRPDSKPTPTPTAKP